MSAQFDVSDANLTVNGPGKFRLAVDEIAHAATMEGWHDDTDHEGHDQFNGNVWLICTSYFDSPDLVWEGQTPLSASDHAFLRRQRAVVVVEYPSGATDVTWFEDAHAGREYYGEVAPGFALPEDWDGE